MSKENGKYRVLHAPYDVGGNAYHLARAESELGWESQTLVYYKQWFGYPCDKNLKIKPGTDPLTRPSWWVAMWNVARKYDVLHFNFGGSFLNDVVRERVYTDVPFWRRLGVATFVSFQGCDSRISGYCLANFSINACAKCRSLSFCEDKYDNFRRECISQIGRHFDGVFAVNPDLMHTIPGAKFLPYSSCDLEAWKPPRGFDWHHKGPKRILHAPTWREIKGTEIIIKAVEELRSEGENVELVLVEKIPHDKVRAIYNSVDILVDQLLVGWYGGLAVELMALGKPVVAYIRKSDLRFIPRKMESELPVVNADASTLKDVLRPLIRNSEALRNLGEQSRRFVEKWHHPRVVAYITSAAYRNTIEKKRRQSRKIKKTQVAWKTSAPTIKTLLKLYFRSSSAYSILKRLLNKLFPVSFYVLLPLIRLRSLKRLRQGTPASVWGTTPILTIPLLARCDRLLGFKSHTVVYTVYHITSMFDLVLKDKIDQLCKYTPFLLNTYYRYLFIKSLMRYDVFHYFYDQGFLERNGRFGVNREELQLLKKAGKRVYLYAYGADVRTRQATEELGEYHCCLHCDSVVRQCICSDSEGQEKQAFFRENTTALISMGDMMEYIPEAIDLQYWPIDTDQVPFVGAKWDGESPLKILHVPNHEWAKGSVYLRNALEVLRGYGVRFELIQVTNVPNSEVLRLMGEADIIADQFLIGWFGYTALEALAIGKVVLCYIRDRDMLLNADECPIVSANPDTLQEVLGDLANWHPTRFEKLGRTGREYVQKYYSIPAVAGRLAELYLETARFPERTVQRIKNCAEKIHMNHQNKSRNRSTPADPYYSTADAKAPDKY